jgi:dephospho-CoA kinase
MKVIGLTGGIASGKSTTAGFLKELGAVIIDADKVGHEVFEPNSEGWEEVVDAFGTGILTPQGEIDRKQLGKIVFGDPRALVRLNRIVHPRIYEMIKARIEEYRQKGAKVVVIEAPLLLEPELPLLADEVDAIWVTVARESTVVKRLEKKAGFSEAEARARMRSQLSSEERVKRADVVIDTDGSLAALKAKVKELWQSLA